MVKSIPNDIFQYSLHSAWHAGLRDGGPPVGFLANHGNHGIGFFEDEQTELMQIDGVAYGIDKDGNVEEADEEDQLPFVMVTIFQPKEKARLDVKSNASNVKDVFVNQTKNTPTSFQLRGSFSYLNTQQRTFWGVKGTIFGFAIPAWQKSVSGEGLQCCFLSEDKKHGGRVIDFETGKDIVLEWAKCGRFHLGFPQDEEFDELRL